MRIVIIDDSGLRATVLEEGLRDAGYDDIHIVPPRGAFVARLERMAPDVVLMDPQYAPKVNAKPHVREMVQLIEASAKSENVDLFHRYDLMKRWYDVDKVDAISEVVNSAVAFAVSIPELAQYAQQASEQSSFVQIFVPVTLLYFVSAFVINRVAKFIEHRVRVPGILGAK